MKKYIFVYQTFRPKKRFTQGTIRYSLHKQAQASLQSGINLRKVVKLPEGENLNDWIAVHGKHSKYLNSHSCQKFKLSYLYFTCTKWLIFSIASI